MSESIFFKSVGNFLRTKKFFYAFVLAIFIVALVHFDSKSTSEAIASTFWDYLRINAILYISLIGTLLGIIIAVFAFLDSKSASIAIAGTLDKVNQNLDKIDRNMDEASTKNVEVYPGNIDDIIEKVFDFCDNNPHVKRLEIYTDVIGYAMLTDNHRWHNYWSKITELVNNSKNKNFSLKWYYYDKDLRKIINARQFSRLKNDSTELQNFLKKTKEHLKAYCDKCTHDKDCSYADDVSKECRLVNNMKDYTTLMANLEQLQIEKESNLMALKQTKKNKEITTVPRNSEFPFHAWIVVDNDDIPVRGIITYPTHEGISTENGIYSKDRRFLGIQYGVMRTNIV